MLYLKKNCDLDDEFVCSEILLNVEPGKILLPFGKGGVCQPVAACLQVKLVGWEVTGSFGTVLRSVPGAMDSLASTGRSHLVMTLSKNQS